MANEMRTFTFGGVTHPIEDAAAIKSAIMSGSTLQLKDADGTVRSSVAIPTSGLKRYKVVQDYAYGGYALQDYDTGTTLSQLTKDELFLLMGDGYQLGTALVNSYTQLYNYTVSFAADLSYAPHLSGLDDAAPASWQLFLPVGKAVLCFYDHSDKKIYILDDQYIICEMSTTQAQNMAGIGIKYRATGGSSWTNFTPGASNAACYYTRSHIYLASNAVPMPTNQNEILIGGSVTVPGGGSQSIDVPWTIEAVLSGSSNIYSQVPKIYPAVFAGIDSTENAPYFKIGLDQAAAPQFWNIIVLKQIVSLIQ